MAYLIALGILSLIGIVATAWVVRTDGYGRIPTDPSRVSRAERPARAAAPVASEPAVTRVVASPTTAPLRVVRAD